MAFDFLFDEKTYQATGKYLYSGVFNGFLATGGLFSLQHSFYSGPSPPLSPSLSLLRPPSRP